MSRPQRVTNETIYQAAHDIIMQRGPNALTFQALGKATGLVPAALVRRFKNKQQLFIEVDTYCLALAANTLSQADEHFDAKLDAIIHSLSSDMAFAVSAKIYINGLAFLLKSLDNPRLYSNYQIAFNRQKDSLTQLLEQAKMQKELRYDVDCTELARLLQITQQGACHVWIMTQQEPIQVCIERYLRLLLNAYKVSEPQNFL